MKMFDKRSNLRELLPWYENGTLHAEEREAVRALLATDLEANRQRRELHVLHDALIEEPLLAANMESNLRRLRVQISTQRATSPLRIPRPWLALAALAMLLLCSATFFAGMRVGPYRTLSTPAPTEMLATDTDLLRVDVVAGVDAATLCGIAGDPDVRVLHGPSGHGVATLAVPHAHAQQVIARLQGDARLRFVVTVPREP